MNFGLDASDFVQVSVTRLFRLENMETTETKEKD